MNWGDFPGLVISDTFPDAILWPADKTNYYTPSGHGGVPNRPRGLVLHTPQEPADGYAYTPVFFASPNRQASTHYFASYGGALFQMVPEDCMAIANGVLGKPYPAWANPATSLNWQTLSIEIEGEAASMAQTCPRGSRQWNVVVRWIVWLCQKYAIPLDRAHVIGHYQVANNRSDPGTLDIDQLVRDAQAAAEEDDNMSSACWVRDSASGKSYIIVGGKKRHVVDAAQEAALLKAGYIRRPEVIMTPAELASISDAPY